MQKEIEDYARALLARRLELLPEASFALFRRIYAHSRPDWGIGQVAAGIPARDLDGALGLVNRTLREKGLID